MIDHFRNKSSCVFVYMQLFVKLITVKSFVFLGHGISWFNDIEHVCGYLNAWFSNYMRK